MKQGKYIIGIERDAIRCSFSGRKSTKAFPKAFGNKEKNIFISTIDEDDDSVLRLKVSSSNYKDAYIKMQEVTNVVVNELLLLVEMIYASSFYNDEVLAKGKISLQIDKEFYEELKEDYDLPESLEEAYLKIKERDLYQFGAKDPEAAVNAKLRCHCEGLDFPGASPVKYFKIVGQKGTRNLYALVKEDQEDLADKDEPKKKSKPVSEDDLLPEEKIDLTYLFYKNNIKRQILDHILDCHPSFFEQLVVNPLLEMGYGSDELSGHVLGKSHDGGIDGVIYEDKLGLSKIYIQAKRNDSSNTIGRPLLQAFVGAMQDVQKGVFITTSTFTKEARNYAEKQQQKSLKLIDGDLLAELMIKYGIGLEKVQTYTVYKINEDFFE